MESEQMCDYCITRPKVLGRIMQPCSSLACDTVIVVLD